MQTESTGTGLNASIFGTQPVVVVKPHKEMVVKDQFLPCSPNNLMEAGLHKNDIIPLILKFLFLHGQQFGRRIAVQIKLPYQLIEPILGVLKIDQLISPKNSAGLGDFEFQLTPKGVEQAKLHLSRSSYCGSAPVCLADYRDAVNKQSIRNCRPTFDQVKNAYRDLMVNELTINQIGQALNSSRSIFIFGAPGNGKSALAVRAIKSIDQHIWIPRAITIGGEVIRLFDPVVHIEAPLPEDDSITRSFQADDRWIRIKRPTIVVGGELELKHLDAVFNPTTGIIEAPIHVKSNCGCLVVDDLGRQQVSPTELLNRWIVPMESSNDYVNLPSGRQISLPFQQLLIFATNLKPAELCDEAFLRRIPYKVEVFDPSEKQFKDLFDLEMAQLGFHCEEGVVDRLIEYHYKRVGRPFRFCHVRDLLLQAKDFCEFHQRPLVFRNDIVELAVLNYFSGMQHQLHI